MQLRQGGNGLIRPVFAITVGAEWCTEAARAADLTFANEVEVIRLASSICKATSKAAPEDYEAAMAVIARWKHKGWMIGTRSSKGVGCIGSKSDAGLFQVPVPQVSPEEFVDDVGAGDAFMGGFLEAIWQPLAALAQEEAVDSAETAGKRKLEDIALASRLTVDNMKDAVRAGITAAGACIRCSGCQFKE
ncbi:ADK2 [Symbiodinium pilosum]|uniref:Adenosine kinase n=1 Tax=Symbiodinium pilosum TaxID=2952 RepID=A0A812S9F0_SYMPI|nr:ADK2 [Symbiodinium pilosum]